jgi:acetolactate synthase-1/2/3 large subunit
MKLSDYIVQVLEDYIKHLFLLPGGGCIHLVDSFSKSKIELIPVLHEQAASIAAESYAQKSNSLSALLVTTGPGATNAVTGIASAWLDSIPVLIISGQVQNKDRAKNLGIRQLGFQEIDTIKIYKSITKYAITVDCAKDIKYHLEKAIWLATHERPGPVLLDIPLDIQSTEIDIDSLLGFNPPKLNYDTSIIPKIKEDLTKAKRPILLVGNGVRLADSIPLCLEFIQKTNIPVLTSWKMMDLFADDHPQFVGRPGGVGQRGANFNQQNSDFIICVGARLDHGQLAYQHKYFAREAKKCIVDIDQNEISKLTCKIEYSVPMDAKVFFSSMNHLINKLEIDEWLLFCKNLYNKYPVILPEYLDSSFLRVNNYAFIHYLSDLLPEESLLVPGSSGACSEVTMQAFRVKNKTRIYNSEGLGSMGFGIPAAIGGCLANNKKTTISIDGDGGFFMNIQELELVHRYNLPIKFFVLNNNGYGSIRTTQNTHFGGRVIASDPESGLTLPSIEKNAYAYNIPYVLIKDQSNLAKELENVLNIEGPIICELLVDQNHKTIPKASVYKKADGSFETRPMEDLAPFLDREEFLANLLISPIDLNI